MNTQLTDFTPEQLQLLLNAIVSYREDIKLGRVASKDYEHNEQLRDDLSLLRTQILTAIGLVGARQLPEMN